MWTVGWNPIGLDNVVRRPRCNGAAAGIETAGSANWNLEFAGPSGLAPADQDAFYKRFRDKRVVSTQDPQGTFYYLDVLSRAQFRKNDFGDLHDGTYT